MASHDNDIKRVDRARQWTGWLAIATSVFVLFMTLSGLSIWLLPFSVASQIVVYLHTLVGVGFFLFCSWYLIRHWLIYKANQMNHIVLLGYLGVAALVICNLSGLVLTVQALFGPVISYTWDAIHIVTTFALVVFALPHVLLIVFRDRKAWASGTATPVEATGAHGRAVLVATVSLLAGLALAIYAYQPPELDEEFSPDYSFKYGEDRPFAPSLALTATGMAYDTKLLSGSEGCGTAGCHEEIFHEWEASAHRYAAMDPTFQAVQMNMAQQNGPESTRYCGGCHDPISLFSGTKNLYTDPEKLTALQGYQEGVSCLSCHAVRTVDVQGNANYEMGKPARYMFELEYDASPSPTLRLFRDFLIRAYPREHVESLSKTLFKAPEYCAACHKQFVDEEINEVGWVQLQNQYDNWRKSRWNHPDEPRRTVECRECHMPLTASNDPAAGDERDYNRSATDGKHRSHRFLGANQMVPALLDLPGGAEHIQLVEKWLQGKIEIPEIADKWAAGPAVSIDLVAPESVQPGDPMAVKVVITSNKVGHDFPTGPLDIIQSWVEVVVKDETGEVIFESGTVDEKGFIKPGSFIFKAEPVDQYGNLIDRHNLWEMVGVRHRRALFPGFSDTAEYELMCPDLRRAKKVFPSGTVEVNAPEGPGKLTITARLLYRKADQYLLNFIFGEASGLTSPITEMDVVTREVTVGEPSAD